MVKLTKKTA